MSTYLGANMEDRAIFTETSDRQGEFAVVCLFSIMSRDVKNILS